MMPCRTSPRRVKTTIRATSGSTPSLLLRRAEARSVVEKVTTAFSTKSTTTAGSRSTAADSTATIPELTASWWYPVLGGFLITVAGGMKYFHDHVGGTEGVVRSIKFYSSAIPKYVVYRYHVWNQSPDHVWDELDRDTSQLALSKILELEGFYVKCGQMCAANIGNAFPPIWQDTMSVLQDQVPPQKFETIKSIVESELDFENTFASFDPVPIGSASIGQVHRATLQDGTAVVVKVCYPDVERLLRGDVRTIKAFAAVAQPVHVPALEEMEKQFQNEFDYRREARQLATVRENLIKAGLAGTGPDNHRLCQIPKPYLQYCTKRVLVMEELFGEKLAVELRRDMEHQATREKKTVEQFLHDQRQKEMEYEQRGETMQGPTAAEYEYYISVLDGTRKVRNAWNRIYNMTAGLFLLSSRSSSKRTYADKSELPINHAKMVDDLLYIHGHEVLVDGYFNGDPHPGNILLCRTADGSPQLGLIDYGQVKSLTKEQRHLFCKLVIALNDDDKPRIIQLMKQAGFQSERMDPDVIYLYAKVGYDMDNQQLTGGLHIQMFMEEIQSRDPIIQLPQDYLMVARASLMLRGLAHALHQSRSVAAAWRPIAERVLREDL